MRVRVHLVKKAQKDQGVCTRAGCSHTIVAGETYRWAKKLTGPRSSRRYVWCARHQPRPSETCGNDTLAEYYAAVEALRDFVDQGDSFTREEAQDAIEECKSALEGCRDTWEERMGNMDQANLGGSPAYETLQERYDGAEALVQALDSLYLDDEPEADEQDVLMAVTEEDEEALQESVQDAMDTWEQEVRDAIDGALQEDCL